MSVKCEKCGQSDMIKDRIYRLSTVLVVIGYFLIIPGILLMVGGLSCSFLGAGSTMAASAAGFDKLREETAQKLLQAGGGQELSNKFKKTGNLTASYMSQLPEEKQRELRIIAKSYDMQIAGSALGSAGVAACGGAFTVFTFLAGLPAFIIGFLLILKRKIWLCPGCGFFYDRA
jgi:hypothetical protein